MQQISLFDMDKTPLKIDKPIRLIELFAGIGSQAKALSRLGVDFEHYRVCEFDRYAIKSYNAVHGTNFVTSDITQLTAQDLGIVDTDKYCYLMTYSFPCQDLSLAGKGNGMAKGSGTRSGLLWEVERLLNECEELPQILLMENVTQVHGKKNIEQFNEWLDFLESKGYSNYWKDLNAKNFGIPQNRDRTFMVSVLGNYTYEFPKQFPLELRLKDMLEDSVDEKFYISNENTEKIMQNLPKTNEISTGLVGKQATEFKKLTDVSNTLMARDYKGFGNQEMNCVIEPQINVVGNYSPSNHDASRIVDTNGLAPTVKENHGTVTGVVEPCIVEDFYKNRAERVYEGVAPTLRSERQGLKVCAPVRLGYIPYPNSNKPHQSNTFYDENEISPTLDTCTGSNRQVKVLRHGVKIRKLTPKECWRLMGFDDTDFEKAAKENSNTQLYKQAGNSIVVDVLYYIFKQMF